MQFNEFTSNFYDIEGTFIGFYERGNENLIPLDQIQPNREYENLSPVFNMRLKHKISGETFETRVVFGNDKQITAFINDVKQAVARGKNVQEAINQQISDVVKDFNNPEHYLPRVTS